jgi:hypothetical protein
VRAPKTTGASPWVLVALSAPTGAARAGHAPGFQHGRRGLGAGTIVPVSTRTSALKCASAVTASASACIAGPTARAACAARPWRAKRWCRSFSFAARTCSHRAAHVTCQGACHMSRRMSHVKAHVTCQGACHMSRRMSVVNKRDNSPTTAPNCCRTATAPSARII